MYKSQQGCFLLLFLVLTLTSMPTHASDWRMIESGLYYKTIEFRKSASPAPSYLIHVFKIDPEKYFFQPILTKSRTSVRNMAENSGALLAVNANFFDTDNKPLGLIVSDGKTLNPFRPISWWGVFYIDGSGPHIVSSRGFERIISMSAAVQAGPRLVVDGSIPRLKSSKSPKTAVGINSKREILLVTTLFPIPVKELARLMAGSESKGGLGCVDALNLDGGSSSQLYARYGSFELNLPSYIGVPVGLGVFRK